MDDLRVTEGNFLGYNKSKRRQAIALIVVSVLCIGFLVGWSINQERVDNWRGRFITAMNCVRKGCHDDYIKEYMRSEGNVGWMLGIVADNIVSGAYDADRMCKKDIYVDVKEPKIKFPAHEAGLNVSRSQVLCNFEGTDGAVLEIDEFREYNDYTVIIVAAPDKYRVLTKDKTTNTSSGDVEVLRGLMFSGDNNTDLSGILIEVKDGYIELYEAWPGARNTNVVKSRSKLEETNVADVSTEFILEVNAIDFGQATFLGDEARDKNES